MDTGCGPDHGGSPDHQRSCSASPEVANESTPVERPSGEPYTELKKEDYVFCASSENLKLYFQPSTTHFLVENLQDGSQWYSSPQDLEEETGSRLEQMKMQASLVVDYTNLNTKKTGTTNTYAGSVAQRRLYGGTAAGRSLLSLFYLRNRRHDSLLCKAGRKFFDNRRGYGGD